jgi:hypothetical protein
MITQLLITIIDITSRIMNTPPVKIATKVYVVVVTSSAVDVSLNG